MIGAALLPFPLSLKTVTHKDLLSDYGPHLIWWPGIYV